MAAFILELGWGSDVQGAFIRGWQWVLSVGWATSALPGAPLAKSTLCGMVSGCQENCFESCKAMSAMSPGSKQVTGFKGRGNGHHLWVGGEGA